MKQIERTIAASGIIGKFDTGWTIIRLHDNKYNSDCYNLYINENIFNTYESVAAALKDLVKQFEE